MHRLGHVSILLRGGWDNCKADCKRCLCTKNSPLLGICSALVSGSTTIAQSYLAYCLLRSHLAGQTESEGREYFVSEMTTYENSPTNIKRLVKDGFTLRASSVRTYFLLNPIVTSLTSSLNEGSISLPCSVDQGLNSTMRAIVMSRIIR